MKSKMLDKQIAYKTEMKRILNEQQYERYEKWLLENKETQQER